MGRRDGYSQHDRETLDVIRELSDAIAACRCELCSWIITRSFEYLNGKRDTSELVVPQKEEE